MSTPADPAVVRLASGDMVLDALRRRRERKAQPTTPDPQALLDLALSAAREVAEEHGIDSDAAHGAAEVLRAILTFESTPALDLMRAES